VYFNISLHYYLADFMLFKIKYFRINFIQFSQDFTFFWERVLIDCYIEEAQLGPSSVTKALLIQLNIYMTF